MRINSIFLCSTTLALSVAFAATTSGAPSHPPTPTFMAGKVLVAKYHCNSCHGANLKGKGGAPSLHVSGITGRYNITGWENVLGGGYTKHDGRVKPPMPVFHMKPADAAAIYQYLYSLPR